MKREKTRLIKKIAILRFYQLY